MENDETFDQKLAKVQGNIRHVNVANEFDKKANGLLYFWNKAERLNRGALVISQSDQMLNDIFALLSGLSLELLLKGVLLGLEIKYPTNHKLVQLCQLSGIPISEDERIILQALTEHVIWASKYPAPKHAKSLLSSSEIFSKQRQRSGNLSDLDIPERSISPENYGRIWLRFAAYFICVQGNTFESASNSSGE